MVVASNTLKSAVKILRLNVSGQGRLLSTSFGLFLLHQHSIADLIFQATTSRHVLSILDCDVYHLSHIPQALRFH
mgnify:CR=1 FL=1